MNKLKDYIVVWAAWLLFSGVAPAEQPNIVLFLVDDMGWQDTSVPFWIQPTPFNERYRTPHMETLRLRLIAPSDPSLCLVTFS